MGFSLLCACACIARRITEMAVAVCVLLAALLVLYWSSSRVEGNHKKLLHYPNLLHTAFHPSCFHKKYVASIYISDEAPI